MTRSAWLLLDSLTYGGIESHVLELAKGLRKFDIRVTVVLTTDYNTQAELLPRLQACSISHCYLSELGANLRQAVTKHKPDVVHTHGYKANIMAKVLLQFLPVRIVSTFHAGETPSGRVRVYDFVDRYSAFLSHLNLCVSEKIRSKLPFKSELLRNFIQIPDTKASSPTKHFGFIGRLSHEKGPDRFVEIAKRHPQSQFHIYGDGPMRELLEQNAPANVVFEGFQTEMEAVYDKLALLIITSRFEGLPMTALEAMAREVPVLSLDVGGMATLIDSERNGFVVGSLDELSAHLSKFQALDQSEQVEIALAAKARIIERHSCEAVIPELIEKYQFTQN